MVIARPDEPLVAAAAALGASVLAVEIDRVPFGSYAWLDPTLPLAMWRGFRNPGICGEEAFARQVSYRLLPADEVFGHRLPGSFDLVWTSGMAHEAGGPREILQFLESSRTWLRTGGLAAHTLDIHRDEGDAETSLPDRRALWEIAEEQEPRRPALRRFEPKPRPEAARRSGSLNADDREVPSEAGPVTSAGVALVG